MFSNLMPALWGFVGALIFAAPRYAVCVREARVAATPCGVCGLDALVALMVGTCGAFAFAPFLAEWFGATKEPATRAIGAIIGMIANPVAPQLNKALGDGVVGTVRKWLPPGDGRT